MDFQIKNKTAIVSGEVQQEDIDEYNRLLQEEEE